MPHKILNTITTTTALILMIFVSSSFAFSTKCPLINNITCIANSNGGYECSATGPSGYTWEGQSTNNHPASFNHAGLFSYPGSFEPMPYCFYTMQNGKTMDMMLNIKAQKLLVCFAKYGGGNLWQQPYQGSMWLKCSNSPGLCAISCHIQ